MMNLSDSVKLSRDFPRNFSKSFLASLGSVDGTVGGFMPEHDEKSRKSKAFKPSRRTPEPEPEYEDEMVVEFHADEVLNGADNNSYVSFLGASMLFSGGSGSDASYSLNNVVGYLTFRALTSNQRLGDYRLRSYLTKRRKKKAGPGRQVR